MKEPEIALFLDYLDKVHRRTVRVVEDVPEQSLDWTPRPGAFSLGDLIRHIAATKRHMFAENALGKPSRYQGCSRDLAGSAEEIREFLNRCHDETISALRGLSEAQWNAKCTTPGDTSITVWKWMRLMAEHEIHHRGQIYTYLSLLGIATAPLYGLTSEQVADKATGD